MKINLWSNTLSSVILGSSLFSIILFIGMLLGEFIVEVVILYSSNNFSRNSLDFLMNDFGFGRKLVISLILGTANFFFIRSFKPNDKSYEND